MSTWRWEGSRVTGVTAGCGGCRPRISGRRDVEAVAREEEVEGARHVLGARGGHRVEDHGRLAPLELVDGANGHVAEPGGLQSAPEQAHLHVVRRDHHEVGLFEWARLAVAVGPRAAQ